MPDGLKDSGISGRYVDGRKLLELLFEADCRPSMRWLRDRQKQHALPFVKIGRLVYFDPVVVKLHLDARNTRRARVITVPGRVAPADFKAEAGQ